LSSSISMSLSTTRSISNSTSGLCSCIATSVTYFYSKFSASLIDPQPFWNSSI
jgi:hypothetical protein